MASATIAASLNEIRGLIAEGLRVLDHLRRTQEAVLRHLAITAEAGSREIPSTANAGSLRLEIVKSLLEARSSTATEMAKLDYQIHAHWHLGVVAMGVSAEEVLAKLSRVGEISLCVAYHSDAWIWYGSRRRASVAAIEELSECVSSDSLLAVGEPGHGLDGWRLTHYQAQAALGVALHMPERFARYTDHRLLAAALQNETLAKSLEQKYLRLFDGQRDGGAKLRQTLRAHIDAGCVASSAAAVLGVDRHTVEDRVRTVERLLGCSLRACLAELDVALRVGELNASRACDEALLDAGAVAPLWRA